jgi:hypothetical protein
MSIALMDDQLSKPKPIGSYDSRDVVFLLKDISGMLTETSTEEREGRIQSGGHYSEMLPIEYNPSQEYMNLFFQTLEETAQKVALAAGIVSELILAKKGAKVVLVSLARAGTPVGILMKRYLSKVYQLDLPHYSISIIRGKGIDENAIRYILQNHPEGVIQFVDGWTGKGAITRELTEACQDYYQLHGYQLDDDLAVLADPGYCAKLFGTREDFLIPSACLNSTVSGLVSRTVYRKDLIAGGDFHGAKFYQELSKEDVSILFVDTVSAYFTSIMQQAKAMAKEHLEHTIQVTWQGLEVVRKLQKRFNLGDINLIKPGVGETTRVLLRRTPWKILVDNKDNPNLQHILILAANKEVPVEVCPDLSYSCCGLILPLRETTDDFCQ